MMSLSFRAICETLIGRSRKRDLSDLAGSWREDPAFDSAIAEMHERVDAMPTLDDRTPDEILDYDEHGLPR